MNGDISRYFTDSPLFGFDMSKSSSLYRMDNWWITAYSHSPILEATKQLLFAYWEKEMGLEHYLLFYLFFTMACEAFPEEWDAVPKHSHIDTHAMKREIFKPYSTERYQQIADMCVVQKLSYKFKLPDDLSGTFYEKLILDPQV